MNKLTVFLLSLVAIVTFNSCLNNNKATTTISDEAKITKFTLKGNNTVKDYTFTVNSTDMTIYNADSLPFNTRIDSLYAIINPTFYKVYINDSIDFYLFDTLWMKFDQPVTYTVVASDKKTEATYTLTVNRHTVDPDTTIWTGINSEVFTGVAADERALLFGDQLLYITLINNKIEIRTSADGAVWTPLTLTGLPQTATDADISHAVASSTNLYLTVGDKLYTSTDATTWQSSVSIDPSVRLLFVLNDKLHAAKNADGTQTLIRLDGSTWTECTTLPGQFPVDGEAITVATSPTGVERVFVVGGINTDDKMLSSVWSTENGNYWSDLSAGIERFTPRADAAVIQYADHLMLFGGRDAAGKVITKEMWSKDYGMNWSSMDSTKKQLPQLFVRRYDLSAITTPSGYVYLIGGRASATTQIADVWRGLNYASLPDFKK